MRSERIVRPDLNRCTLADGVAFSATFNGEGLDSVESGDTHAIPVLTGVKGAS